MEQRRLDALSDSDDILFQRLKIHVQGKTEGFGPDMIRRYKDNRSWTFKQRQAIKKMVGWA